MKLEAYYRLDWTLRCWNLKYSLTIQFCGLHLQLTVPRDYDLKISRLLSFTEGVEVIGHRRPVRTGDGRPEPHDQGVQRRFERHRPAGKPPAS